MLFGGLGLAGKSLLSVEKYSLANKTWNYVSDLPDERHNFCACSFMDKIYLFGGYIYGAIYLKSCFEFNAKIIKWKEVANMYTPREYLACSLFEGIIVVLVDIIEADTL